MKRRNFLKTIAGLFAAVSLPASAAIKPEKEDKREQLWRWFAKAIKDRDGINIIQTRIYPRPMIKPLTPINLDDVFSQVLPDDHPMKPAARGKGELFINHADGSRTKIGTVSNVEFTPPKHINCHGVMKPIRVIQSVRHKWPIRKD